MPSLDTIRNLTIRATTPGVDQAAASLDRLSAAHGRVASSAETMATVTDMSSRRTLSAQAALERLASAHDATYRAQQQHARGAAVLERATAQGLAGTQAFAVAQAALNRLHREGAETVGLNRMQMMEATHVAKAFFDEIAAGQSPLRALQTEGGRIAQIFAEGQGGVGGTFRALSGIVGRLATGWIGMTIAVAGATAVVTAATLAYESSQQRLQRALEGTGRAAGMTRQQLDAVAQAGGAAGHLGMGEARSLAAGFAQAGVGAGLSTSLIASAPRFARFNDQDTGEAGKSLADAFRDPVAGAQSLDRSLGFLDDRIATTIRDYEASGQHAAAQRTLFDAYEAALKQTTDSTWALGDAMREAKRWGGSVVDWIGKQANDALTGGLSQEEQLKAWRSYLPNASDSALSFGRFNRSYVEQRIDELQRQLAVKADPVAAARDAETNRLSGLVGPLVRNLMPELTRATDATNHLTLLRQALNDPSIVAKLGAGVGTDQVRSAFDRTAVLQANADPAKRALQDYDLARAAADAFSLAEHAAVDARRAELAVLRESGDVQRAALAARIAENEAIAKANSDAKDRLEQAKQDAALVGLTSYERGRQQIVNQFEGYGGIFDKDAASRSELTEAMRPVADDLRQAGQSIVAALRSAATAIADASPYGALTPMRPNDFVGPFNPAPFKGAAGVSDHERQAVEMLVSAGYSRVGAVGFVGGLAGESSTGLDPLADNASGHRGIAQWDASRYAQLSAMGDPTDFLTQVRFIIHELQTTEARAGAALKGASTVQGGLTANLLYERPAQSEIASSYNARLAYGNALGLDLIGRHETGQRVYGAPPLTIQAGAGAANDNGRVGAGVPLIASTALTSDRAAEASKLGAYELAAQRGPIDDATRALAAQRDALQAQIATVGQSKDAIAAAAEKQKLLTTYEQEHIPVTAQMRQQIDALAAGYGHLAKQQDDFQQRQQDLIGALDSFRDASKGALSSFVSDMMAGKSATQALHDALNSVAGKLAGKLEDSVVDSLFGKSGTPGGGLFGGGLAGLLGGGSGSAGFLSSLGSGAGYASGGFIRGAGTYTSDSVPALLSAGEFVVRASSAAANANLLHRINETGMPRFADGGMVGGGARASNMPALSGDTHNWTIDARGAQMGVAEQIDAKLRAFAQQVPAIMSEQKRRAA